MHLVCSLTGLAFVEKGCSSRHCHTMMKGESGSEIGHAGRTKAPALYSVNGSLHEVCEGALVQEGLLYVVLAQILHHINATGFQCLPENLQHASFKIYPLAESKSTEAHMAVCLMTCCHSTC